MKRTSAFFALLFLIALNSYGQTVSYWFQNWQRKPDAQQAAAYFMVPGANITFTYQTNRVILNSVGGAGLFQLTGDVLGGVGLPVPTTLAVIGGGGVNTKITFDTKGRVTGSTAALLASADFQNQGTTTTVLHGNAAGNPSWGQVNLASDVTGTLPGVWLTTGNTGAGNFLGSTDNQPLQFRVNNAQVGLFATDQTFRTANNVYSGFGMFSVCTNNGIAAALNIDSPRDKWASASAFGAGPFVPATVTAATYYRLTNYVYGVTNGWGFHLTKTNGVLTNAYSGWYKITFSVSGFGNTGNEIEADIMTNGVTTDAIAAHWTTAVAAKSGSGSGTGVFFLTNNSSVAIAIQNIDSTSLTVTHAQLTVGAP